MFVSASITILFVGLLSVLCASFSLFVELSCRKIQTQTVGNWKACCDRALLPNLQISSLLILLELPVTGSVLECCLILAFHKASCVSASYFCCR